MDKGGKRPLESNINGSTRESLLEKTCPWPLYLFAVRSLLLCSSDASPFEYATSQTYAECSRTQGLVHDWSTSRFKVATVVFLAKTI